MNFGRPIGKIEYEDGYVKKSDIFNALEAVEKEEDCEYGDYGSVLSKSYTCEYGEVCDAIYLVEIEDVQPVVHAKWIPPKNDDGMSDPIEYQVRCSNCGFDLDPQTFWVELKKFGADKYCPNCGARCDGE